MPFCHSYNKPIAKKITKALIRSVFLALLGSSGKESIITISISKIKNKREIKKNWKEKGSWEGFMMLKPHSNWLQFISRSLPLFFTFKIAFLKIKMRPNLVNQIIVVFIYLFYLSNWKLAVLLYTMEIGYAPHQYTTEYKKSQTTSTKCQYQAAHSNPIRCLFVVIIFLNRCKETNKKIDPRIT